MNIGNTLLITLCLLVSLDNVIYPVGIIFLVVGRHLLQHFLPFLGELVQVLQYGIKVLFGEGLAQFFGHRVSIKSFQGFVQLLLHPLLEVLSYATIDRYAQASCEFLVARQIQNVLIEVPYRLGTLDFFCKFRNCVLNVFLLLG